MDIIERIEDAKRKASEILATIQDGQSDYDACYAASCNAFCITDEALTDALNLLRRIKDWEDNFPPKMPSHPIYENV